MRTHNQIITDGGGPTAVARLVGAQPGTVKQWRRAASIPAPYWRAFDMRGLATLDELALAVAKPALENGETEQVASSCGVSKVPHSPISCTENENRNVSRTNEPGSPILIGDAA